MPKNVKRYRYIASESPDAINNIPLTYTQGMAWLRGHEKGFRTAHCQNAEEAFGWGDTFALIGFEAGVFDFDATYGDEFVYGDDVPWND